MKKVNIIKLSIVLLILSSLFITEKTYAYWGSDIILTSEKSEYILIGSWIFGYEPVEWASGGSYEPGDIVLYNGVFYVRTNLGGGPVGGMFAPDSFLGWLFWSQNN